MREQDLVALHDLDAEANVIALAAVDAAGLDLGLEKDVAGIEIGEAYLPGPVAFGQEYAGAVVEIKARALGAFLRGRLGRCGIGTLDGLARRAGDGRGRRTLCGWHGGRRRLGGCRLGKSRRSNFSNKRERRSRCFGRCSTSSSSHRFSAPEIRFSAPEIRTSRGLFAAKLSTTANTAAVAAQASRGRSHAGVILPRPLLAAQPARIIQIKEWGQKCHARVPSRETLLQRPHRPHPEELGARVCAPSLSKDGRWLGLACGCPPRRAHRSQACADRVNLSARARSSGRG
jgi:hypothetical protein